MDFARDAESPDVVRRYHFHYNPAYGAYCPAERSCWADLAPDSATLPDHVCHETMWHTTQFYAAEQYHGAHGDLMTRYAVEYPLPLGEQAIRTWQAEALRVTLAAIESGARIDWSGSLPLSMVRQPDAYLGLAVLRHCEAGDVWLLGLVEQAREPAGHWGRFAEPLITTERRAAPKAGGDALTQIERVLWQWYVKTVQEQRTWAGGRPRRLRALTPIEREKIRKFEDRKKYGVAAAAVYAQLPLSTYYYLKDIEREERLSDRPSVNLPR